MTEQEIQTEWVSYAKLQVERDKILSQLRHLDQQSAPLKRQHSNLTRQMQDIYKRIMAAEEAAKQKETKKPDVKKQQKIKAKTAINTIKQKAKKKRTKKNKSRRKR